MYSIKINDVSSALGILLWYSILLEKNYFVYRSDWGPTTGNCSDEMNGKKSATAIPLLLFTISCATTHSFVCASMYACVYSRVSSTCLHTISYMYVWYFLSSPLPESFLMSWETIDSIVGSVLRGMLACIRSTEYTRTIAMNKHKIITS